jgi:hypothetical protein
MFDYQKLRDDDSSRCCLPLFRRHRSKKAPSEVELTQQTLMTHEKIMNRARELDMQRQGIKFKMTELTVFARNHIERDRDRDMAVSCLQERHGLKKQYKTLVRMYTNAKLMANKLEEAALYKRFSQALVESNQTLDHMLRHLDYESIEHVLEQIDDQHVQVSEISDLLSKEQPSSQLDVVSKLDIENEIDELMEHEALLQTEDLPSIETLVPDVIINHSNVKNKNMIRKKQEVTTTHG